MGVPKHEFDIDAHAQRLNRESDEPSSEARLVCFALFAAAPLFAVMTWQESYTWLAIRHYSFPIVLVEVVIIATAFVSGFRPLQTWRGITLTTKLAGICFLLAILVSNTIAAEHRQLAMIGMFTTIVHAIFLAVLLERFRSDWSGFRILALWAMASGAAAYFVLVFALALSQLGNPEFNWPQFGAGVSNVRQIGFYGLTAAGVAAGLLASAKSRRDTLLGALVFTLGAWCVFWSGGRAASGGLILAVILVAAPLGWATARRYAVITSGCLTIGAMLSLALVPGPQWGIGSILFRLTESTGGKGYSSGRSEMWIETFRAIQARPFAGHGQGQFRFIIEAAAGKYNHPHNSALQFLFDWGVLGTAAIALFAFAVLLRASSAVRVQPILALPAIGAASGLAAMSMLDGALHYPFPITIVLICSAIILSIQPKGHSNAR